MANLSSTKQPRKLPNKTRIEQNADRKLTQEGQNTTITETPNETIEERQGPNKTVEQNKPIEPNETFEQNKEP